MFRKVLAIVGLNWISFTNGFIYGHVASMIRSLQKKEEGIDLGEGEISLIASILTTTCIIGFGLAAVVTDKFGRRCPCILFSIISLMNWIVLYNAKEMYQFILSRVLGGISVGAIITLTVFVTSEYTSPKTRAFYLNMVTTVAPAIGTGLGHAVGLVLHWRTLTLFGMCLSAVGIVIPYFWVESPHWLASKGKIEECETAFRILHGNDQSSERELKMLIMVETSKLRRATEINREETLKRFLVEFKRKYFWGLLMLNLVMNIYFAAAGKLVYSTLATVILEEITGTSDVLIFSLLIDGFIVFGSCLSCILIRKTTMRALLFSAGFIANMTSVVFSICFYFKNGQNYFNWINVTLLAIYFISINAGPYPILEALISEMFPLELKVYMFFISGIVLIGTLTLTIILLPCILNVMGYHGLFLMNAAIMSGCLGYIWLKLPETKGRTLQEIEMYFKTNTFDINEELNNEQTKTLV